MSLVGGAALLEVEDLAITFPGDAARVRVVDGVSLSIRRRDAGAGRRIGLRQVDDGALDPAARAEARPDRAGGRIRIDGRELPGAVRRRDAPVRGRLASA